MLKLTYPLKVKSICGFLYRDENLYKKVRNSLEAHLGKIDYESSPMEFSFTNYYQEELGKDLLRRFISFQRLQPADALIGAKLFCLKLARKYACNGKRQINIDPGYLNEAKLVLATTKDFSHRIYLRKGIYAEVTLCFHQGEFCDFPTTYPDYRTQEYKDIFSHIRKIYAEQIHKKA